MGQKATKNINTSRDCKFGQLQYDEEHFKRLADWDASHKGQMMPKSVFCTALKKVHIFFLLRIIYTMAMSSQIVKSPDVSLPKEPFTNKEEIHCCVFEKPCLHRVLLHNR